MTGDGILAHLLNIKIKSKKYTRFFITKGIFKEEFI